MTFYGPHAGFNFFSPHAPMTPTCFSQTLPGTAISRLNRNSKMSKPSNSGNSVQSQGGRGQSSHKGSGGNWPSTTRNASGCGRGNATPKGK